MLKCGSANSFFSAARRSASSTFGCMKPEKSDSGVSLSTGGSSGGRPAASLSAGPALLLRRCSCSRFSARPAAEEVFLLLRHQRPVLRMDERARLDALLRLGPVVVLHVVADPGEDLRRHRHAVDRVAAVQPAPASSELTVTSSGSAALARPCARARTRAAPPTTRSGSSPRARRWCSTSLKPGMQPLLHLAAGRPAGAARRSSCPRARRSAPRRGRPSGSATTRRCITTATFARFLAHMNGYFLCRSTIRSVLL